MFRVEEKTFIDVERKTFVHKPLTAAPSSIHLKSQFKKGVQDPAKPPQDNDEAVRRQVLALSLETEVIADPKKLAYLDFLNKNHQKISSLLNDRFNRQAYEQGHILDHPLKKTTFIDAVSPLVEFSLSFLPHGSEFFALPVPKQILENFQARQNAQSPVPSSEEARKAMQTIIHTFLGHYEDVVGFRETFIEDSKGVFKTPLDGTTKDVLDKNLSGNLTGMYALKMGKQHFDALKKEMNAIKEQLKALDPKSEQAQSQQKILAEKKKAAHQQLELFRQVLANHPDFLVKNSELKRPNDFHRFAHKVEVFKSCADAAADVISLFDEEAGREINVWSNAVVSIAFACASSGEPMMVAQAVSAGVGLIKHWINKGEPSAHAITMGALRQIHASIEALRQDIAALRGEVRNFRIDVNEHFLNVSSQLTAIRNVQLETQAQILGFQTEFEDFRNWLKDTLPEVHETGKENLAVQRDLANRDFSIANRSLSHRDLPQSQMEMASRRFIDHAFDGSLQPVNTGIRINPRLTQVPAHQEALVQDLMKRNLPESEARAFIAKVFSTNSQEGARIKKALQERGMDYGLGFLERVVIEFLGVNPDLIHQAMAAFPTAFSQDRGLAQETRMWARNPKIFVEGLEAQWKAEEKWPDRFPRISRNEIEGLIEAARQIETLAAFFVSPIVIEKAIAQIKLCEKQFEKALLDFANNAELKKRLGVPQHFNLHETMAQFSSPQAKAFMPALSPRGMSEKIGGLTLEMPMALFALNQNALNDFVFASTVGVEVDLHEAPTSNSEDPWKVIPGTLKSGSREISTGSRENGTTRTETWETWVEEKRRVTRGTVAPKFIVKWQGEALGFLQVWKKDPLEITTQRLTRDMRKIEGGEAKNEKDGHDPIKPLAYAEDFKNWWDKDVLINFSLIIETVEIEARKHAPNLNLANMQMTFADNKITSVKILVEGHPEPISLPGLVGVEVKTNIGRIEFQWHQKPPTLRMEQESKFLAAQQKALTLALAALGRKGHPLEVAGENLSEAIFVLKTLKEFGLPDASCTLAPLDDHLSLRNRGIHSLLAGKTYLDFFNLVKETFQKDQVDLEAIQSQLAEASSEKDVGFGPKEVSEVRRRLEALR